MNPLIRLVQPARVRSHRNFPPLSTFFDRLKVLVDGISERFRVLIRRIKWNIVLLSELTSSKTRLGKASRSSKYDEFPFRQVLALRKSPSNSPLSQSVCKRKRASAPNSLRPRSPKSTHRRPSRAIIDPLAPSQNSLMCRCDRTNVVSDAVFDYGDGVVDVGFDGVDEGDCGFEGIV